MHEKLENELNWSVKGAIATRKSPKGLARTHIARTFQTLFRTHIAHVLVCAHVCVCEFFFATHSLKIMVRFHAPSAIILPNCVVVASTLRDISIALAAFPRLDLCGRLLWNIYATFTLLSKAFFSAMSFVRPVRRSHNQSC